MTVHEAFLIAVLKCRRVLGWKWTRGMLDDVNHRLAMDVPDSVHIIYIYIFLSAYARQPARGPTMLAHFVAMLAYVGLSCGQCGPSVGLCWPSLGLCWPMLSQKIRKIGTAKKNHFKTQDILMVGGLSWGYVGPSWGYVGLSWGQCGPILGLCWHILGLCWPILGAMLPHLEGMLADLEAYVGPFWPILRKNGKSTKHCKTRYILMVPRGRRQGVQLLSPTERRELPYGNARRAPGRNSMLAHLVAMLAYVGLSWATPPAADPRAIVVPKWMP